MASSKRDHLVDTALSLFNRDGYHAVGIDRVLAEAGVAKMTLYNHFKSKDDLILAVLRRRDEQFRHWFMRSVEKRASDPRGRLFAAFDAVGEWFASDDFSGCMFINAAAEYAEHDDPIHKIAADHKQMVRSYLKQAAEDAGADDPPELASELMMLVEGATVMAYVAGDKEAAGSARRAAETLIDAHLN